MELRRSGGIGDTATDQLCRMLHDFVLPRGNRFPRSLYMLKRLVKVPDSKQFEFDICIKDCYAWDHIADSRWVLSPGLGRTMSMALGSTHPHFPAVPSCFWAVLMGKSRVQARGLRQRPLPEVRGG